MSDPLDEDPYYHLDGDKTKERIEDLFIKGEIRALQQFSHQLSKTLEDIKLEVIQGGGKVLYCAGDDILFSGRFNTSQCEKLINLFKKQVGHTASIGSGNTGIEIHRALKKAKSEGGGKVFFYYSSTEPENKITM